MKVAFFSYDGSGADIAWRLQEEGHEVRFWVKDDYYKGTYKGMLKSARTWQEAAAGADYAFFDTTKLSEIWQKLPAGMKKFGGAPFADQVEHDRALGHEIMEKAGLAKIESLSFKTYAEAIAHVTTHTAVKHVAKPHGPDIESEHIVLSNRADGKDVEAILTNMEDKGLKLDQPIEVEEKKEGIECAVTVFLNGKGVVGDLAFVNFEHKRFAAGNSGNGLGFLTGEMGEVAYWVRPSQTRLFTEALAKVLPAFLANGYCGLLDIAFIANEQGLWPTEFTPRPGYPPIFLMIETLRTPLNAIFYACASGEDLEIQVKPHWVVGLAVVTPGFPSRDLAEKKSVGTPIFGVTPRNRAHVHFFEAEVGKVGKEKGLVVSKGIGYPMVLTESAQNLSTALRRLYRLANQENDENPSIYNSWYRDDLGRRVMENQERIVALGILPPQAFAA